MSNYTSLMANSLSSSPQRPFSSLKSLDNQIKILSETNKLTNNNMDNDKGTQLGIGKSNLKEKIKESLKKNIKNGENTFLTGFSSKFIQKKSINSLKSVSIIKEKKDLGDCNRKFEDFWDDLMRKEFIPGKIFLVLENYHFETFKIKSHLKYQFSFISKANFISIKLLIFIQKDLENNNKMFFQQKFKTQLEKTNNYNNKSMFNEFYTLSGREITSFTQIEKNDFTLILSKI